MGRRLGFAGVVISEHHGSPDGYLPSPLPMAAAMAAATTTIRITIAAIIAPFHDPLRLAEDIAVVDLLSEGRLSLGSGQRLRRPGIRDVRLSPFGAGRRTTEAIETLRKAWTGEPFEFRGRRRG